jgi:superfamily II DNA or RNA helicase
LRAKIDSVVSFDSDDVNDDLLRAIRTELTTANADKVRAVSEQIRGAQFIPDFLELWSERDGRTILPRGYAHRLEQLASEFGEEVVWENEMIIRPSSEALFRDWSPASLRDYQELARDVMLDWGQGIVQAPTGSGKTRVTLEFIRWAGQKTLVIVGKTALASQWQEVARVLYGYEMGYIGEGKWDVRELTVATWQTLWARRESVDEDFWREFGAVIGDEIHHAGARSLSELLAFFPAFYRIGVSATPRWDESSWPIVKALVGPVVHRSTHDEVGDNLVRPLVRMVSTDFEATYEPTHYDEGGRRIPNNYSTVMKKLVSDTDRNNLVARIARDEAQDGHHVLVVTRRIEHVKQLVSRLQKVLRVGVRLHTLTGAQTGNDAERVRRAISGSEGGTVLISTVAEEALDIPRLDRLVMAFPIRKVPLVEQQVGRILRPAEGKTDAVVYDMVDDVGPLSAQRRQRERLYTRRRWRTEQYEPDSACVLSDPV